MKKNRNFIMFIVMLIMMTMMATLATRQLPQTPLVEVHFEYEDSEQVPNRFRVRNLTDERLTFTKQYEVWLEDVLVQEVKLEEIFHINSGGVYQFSYDFEDGPPEFVSTELPPGIFSLTKIYSFSDTEREHAISISGHMFVVMP